ncbi:MAG: hypothetical protein DI564_13595 [Rhodanobacter denitrificans]|uniref:Poly(3-hydroxyalkanoate) polymerase subunit PhaE n=1 Tax=Rhodanobacter denitrificans TaxID=666685 RepID=A0A2W5K7P5_9GAMM|nr:MAG: hypothetical protein DI564_13595 [Rhodanobacter denitrificans]
MVDRSAGPAGSREWETLSRQYWDAVQQWQQAAASAAPGGAQPWQQGLTLWSQLFGDAGAQGALGERLLGAVKAYLEQTQTLLAAGGAGPEAIAAQLGRIMHAGFDATGGTLGQDGIAEVLRKFGADGARGFEQIAAGLAPVFGGLGNEARAAFDRPAFGFLRERQEHQQRVAQALIDYQTQTRRYDALMMRAGLLGATRFQDKLAERAASERPVESLRALYDLWVDAAEDGYAEVAASMEFREAYGALVNAQMRLRSLLREDVERISVDLGIPTRSEVDSIGRRLQELRRELRGAAGADGRGLAAEVEALRAEIAALKAGGTAASPARAKAVETERPAPAPRVRAAKKTVAPKPRRPAKKAAGGFEARVAQFARTAQAPAPSARKAARPTDKKR